MKASPSFSLTQAKELVFQYPSILRGHLAVDIFGHPCSPTSPEACRFCSIGALQKVIFGDRPPVASEMYVSREYGLLTTAAHLISRLTVAEYHDMYATLSREMVVRLWDTAIELAEVGEEADVRNQRAKAHVLQWTTPRPVNRV